MEDGEIQMKKSFVILCSAIFVVVACITGIWYIQKNVPKLAKNDVPKGNESNKVTAAPTSTPTPTIEVEKIDTARICAVGDIMVHDGQLNAIRGDKYNFKPFFAEAKPILEAADLAIGNLETTIAGADQKYTGYPMFNSPDTLLDALKDAGFDVLSTANNHSLDRREKGVIRTIDNLDERGIKHMGTYKSQEEKEQPLIMDVKGIKVAFMSYTYGTNGIPVTKPHLVNLINIEKMKNDVEKVKEYSPDLIIAYVHFGVEYVRMPNQYQKKVVDALFKSGVDIIFGGHPHVVQPMEKKKITDVDGNEKEVFVIYSMGNFISDQRGDYKDIGVMVNVDVEKSSKTKKTIIKNVEAIPTYVQRTNKNGKRYYRVLPTTLSMKKYEEKKDNMLTKSDYNHIKNVYNQMSKFVDSEIKFR